jgi:prepilin-type N-terminal cleavage/methylation domain-containing protein
MKFFYKPKRGFTLIELLVVISIIGILSTIVYASFGEARMQSRDKARMSGLKEVQLAIELYKAQNGVYPSSGCSSVNTNFVGPGPSSASGYVSCDVYIAGLIPDFIPALPIDPRSETTAGMGFYYRSDGLSYKVVVQNSVETLIVTGYDHEFARCPRSQSIGPCAGAVPANTYAVYSAGAEAW